VRRRASTCDSRPGERENAATLILPLIQPPAHHHRPAAHQGTVRPGPGHGLRGLPALPAEDQAGTVITARALAVTARGGDTRFPGTAGRECEEPVLTGESPPAEKLPGPVRPARRWLSCCALTGTVVHVGSGSAVVAASGGEGESGRIAPGPGEHQPGTGFQAGLRLFSMTLEPPATAVRLARHPR